MISVAQVQSIPTTAVDYFSEQTIRFEKDEEDPEKVCEELPQTVTRILKSSSRPASLRVETPRVPRPSSPLRNEQNVDPTALPDKQRSRDKPKHVSSSEGLLLHVLNKLSHMDLDLTGEITLVGSRAAAQGGFSDVYKGYYTKRGKHVAVKRLRIYADLTWDVVKNFAKEIRIWSLLSHPNVLPLLGYIEEGDYRSLVSEWMEKGSLSKCMSLLNAYELFDMALGIARGLHYLHANKVIHGDLKADNMLVSPTGKALVTDFGISRLESPSSPGYYSTETFRSSVRWLARELFICESTDSTTGHSRHNEKTDVWAFGMTLNELLTCDVPYAELKNDLYAMTSIITGCLPAQPTISESDFGVKFRLQMWSISCKCWAMNPLERPSIGDLLKEMELFNLVGLMN